MGDRLWTGTPSRYVYQPTRSTQPSIPLRSVKWGSASAGKANACFIPSADKRVGVQVKLWKPLQQYLSASEVGFRIRGAITRVCTFTFTFTFLLSLLDIWMLQSRYRLNMPTYSYWQNCGRPYDTRCYFNVRSKADVSQLNLPHGKRQLKSVKSKKQTKIKSGDGYDKN